VRRRRRRKRPRKRETAERRPAGANRELVVSRQSESARDASRSDELAAFARSIGVVTTRLTRGGAGETAARAGSVRACVRTYVGACDNSEESVHVFVVGRTRAVIIAWCDRIFARGASGTRLAGTRLAWTTVALFVSRMYPR